MFFQKSILFVFALLIGNALSAITVTWTGAGANNRWSNSANWDTGTVPNSSSDVIIPTGFGTVRFNYVNRRARSVEIGTGSTLRIIPGAQLRIINGGVGIGVFIEGALDVNGTLVAHNSTSMGILNHGTLRNRGLITMENQSLYGLLNEGDVTNFGSGIMEFLNGGAAENIATADGTFLNEGVIRFLAGGTGGGMVVGDDFENATTGSITFENGNLGRFLAKENTAINNGLVKFINSGESTYPFYILGGSTFTNGTTGELEMDGYGGFAGVGIPSTCTFENRGTVNFYGFTGAIGMYAIGNGRLLNSTNATIEIESDYRGITVNGSLYNYGDLTVSNTQKGIDVFGYAANYTGATMNFEDVVTGIETYASGIFSNKGGDIYFSNIATYDILNAGEFNNYGCSLIEGDNEIFNNNGTFENSAWLSYLTSGNTHSHIGSQILNTGFVIDPYDRFATALDNQEARVIALVNPQANVPYSNALDIANITISGIGDFYLDPGLSVFAGTYNHPTNTYTPNNAAIGATVLYAKGNQGCSRLLTIRIDGSVLPIVNTQPDEQLMLPRKRTVHDTEVKKLKSFPNPTSGFFQTSLPILAATTYELQVLNAQGQIIVRQQGDATHDKLLAFDISDYLAGMYWTRLLQDGKVIAQEKIVLQK